MRTTRFLLIVLALLTISVAASAATLPAPGPGSQAVAPAAAPALDAFLSSLQAPDTPPAAKAAASCGSNFCTTAQRDACSQQCLQHHHGPFVGLECCTDTCTTLCICGSVPVAC
jgi:hypothetical protein